MSWPHYLVIAAGAACLGALLAYWTIRWLGQREPYAQLIHLRHRRKLTFLRMLLLDPRVPAYVKLLPILAIVYVASPIDLIPGIALDDIALVLLALVLIIRLTPHHVVLELLQAAKAVDTMKSSAGTNGQNEDSLTYGC